METPLGYHALGEVLQQAMEQASGGKGKERHAVAGENFEDQAMCEIARRLAGHPAGALLYQAVKKIYESGRLIEIYGMERGVAEVLGAINYAGGAVIIMRERGKAQAGGE